MSDTLPTVVGMGVVSHATETMFGKGGDGGKKRRKSTGVKRKMKKRLAMPKESVSKYRKFGVKIYQAANWHTTKASAERDAGFFRKAGHLARVAKYYDVRTKRWGYVVYVR
jgi:hypothetical protein